MSHCLLADSCEFWFLYIQNKVFNLDINDASSSIILSETLRKLDVIDAFSLYSLLPLMQ